MRSSRRTRKNKVAALVLLAAGLATGAVLAEVGLRIYATVNEPFGRRYKAFDVLSAKVEPLGTMGFRPKPNITIHYSNGTAATTNAMGFRGPTVMIPKPPNTFRIVLLGGSATHGWHVNDHETIDAYMRELLNERYPGSNFEVVNLAFDGYDSHQLVERLRTDGLPLDPDLIIVNSGINDVRNARFPHLQDPDPRTILYRGVLARQRDAQRLGRHNLFTYLKHISYLARLPGYVRSVIANARFENERRKISPNPAAIEYFGRNMKRIVALFRHRAVPILLSSPPSALATKFSPHDTSSVSYWLTNAATTEEYRLALSNQMRKVVTELAREQYAVSYVNHNLPPAMFLDDCHLTPEGNRELAKDFVNASKPFIVAYLHQNAGPSVSNVSPSPSPLPLKWGED